jgi:hypothetical protein
MRPNQKPNCKEKCANGEKFTALGSVLQLVNSVLSAVGLECADPPSHAGGRSGKFPGRATVATAGAFD